MNPNNQKFPTRLDSLAEFFFRFAASGYVPRRWLGNDTPDRSKLSKASFPVKLEIVSHCWKYSEFLSYQLSSLVKFPPHQCTVTMTVFYADEDPDTAGVLAFFEKQAIKNVCWHFVALPKTQLFRRAIGRNMAAKGTDADWIWFTDCDVLFMDNALDVLATRLVGMQELLVYPKSMRVSSPMIGDDERIKKVRSQPAVVNMNVDQFELREFDRAIGALQIVHGDVARTIGYCDTLAVYQKQTPYWRKTYEDRAFRWLLGTQGKPIDVPNVFLVRHIEKGRYRKNSLFSVLRKNFRKIKHAFFD